MQSFNGCVEACNCLNEILGGRGSPLRRVTDETIHELSVRGGNKKGTNIQVRPYIVIYNL